LADRGIVFEPGVRRARKLFRTEKYEISSAIPLYIAPMRAEFNSSAKRSKSNRSSRTRGLRTLAVSQAEVVAAEVVGSDERGNDESGSDMSSRDRSRDMSSRDMSSRDMSSREVIRSEAIGSDVMRAGPVGAGALSAHEPSATSQEGARSATAVPEKSLIEMTATEGLVELPVSEAPRDVSSTRERARRQASPADAGGASHAPVSHAIATHATVAPDGSVNPALQLAQISRSAELATSLSDHVVFNDEKLARKYGSEPIPISILYEAYFDGSIDIPGDLVAFLESRNAFVKHTITRQHLQWAVTNFVPEMVAHSREADARIAREMYDDRGDDFFRAFLGERMAFTCAHLELPSDSLETGNEQSSARICDKLGMRASHRVLDVGCGWGGFLAHVAACRGAEGLGTTLSRVQEAHANRRFAELGVEQQARAIVADYRDLPDEKFDRIVCLEAVERVGVKNLKGFFERVRERLQDDGLFFLQWTGLRRQIRPEDLMWGLFMNKYIFPGADAGLPLSSMLKVAEKAGWEVQGVENVSRHYAQTLRLWRANWESHRESIVSAHGERWFRIWQFFLAWSQIIGEQGSAACFQVVMNKNLDTLDRHLF
jgi:sphingolipid C9-methyltransferase